MFALPLPTKPSAQPHLACCNLEAKPLHKVEITVSLLTVERKATRAGASIPCRVVSGKSLRKNGQHMSDLSLQWLSLDSSSGEVSPDEQPVPIPV